MDAATLEAEGWKSFNSGGFSGTVGPYWVRGKGAERDIGFLSDERHGNNRVTVVHGGALMTFADICLGWGADWALGHEQCVTAQLQLHFVSAAKVGDFIVCRPEVVRKGSSLVFMRGILRVGDTAVAAADGIWKVVGKK